MERRHDPTTIEGRIYRELRRLIVTRKSTPALGGDDTHFFQIDNPHVLGYTRNSNLVCLCNFSEHEQIVSAEVFERFTTGWDSVINLMDNMPYPLNTPFTLQPYAFCWLLRVE
jgi:amylosucrase